MFEDFVKYQDHFNYIDSSEEEDYAQGIKKEAHRNIQNNQRFSYQSSSLSSEDFSGKKKQNSKTKKGSKLNSQKSKLCKINPDDFLINDNYLNQIENIIKENHQKISKKTALLIPDTNPEILENLQKRKKKYGFFLQALEVDKRYTETMSVKVSKLKKQNERKKTVVESRDVKKSMKKDQEQMRKYVLEKKNKQQIVVDKIQKHAYKLGLQRVRQEYKKIKKQVKEIEKNNDLKATKLQIKQRNQIQQLKQQLQRMKQMNRINKLDQAKALKDMQKDVQSNKNLLLTRAETAQQRKFII